MITIEHQIRDHDAAYAALLAERFTIELVMLDKRQLERGGTMV